MNPQSSGNRLLRFVMSRVNGRLFDANAWRYLATYLRPRASGLFGYVAASSLQSLLALPSFFLVRYAFDNAIPNEDVGLLVAIGATIVVFRALHSVIGLALRAFIVRIIKQIAFDMRGDLLVKLYRLSREYHVRVDSSLLHTRIVQDTERVDTLCNALFSGILPALLSSAVLLTFLLYLNWWLVFIGLAVLPVLWLANAITGRLVKNQVQAFQKAFEGFSRGTHFVLRHMDLTRLQAYEKEEVDRQRDTLGQLRDTGNRMSMSYAIHTHVQRNITGLAGVVLLVAGGTAVAHDSMTLGSLLAFFLAAGLLNGAVDTALSGLPNVIMGNESLATLQQLMGDGPHDAYHGTKAIDFDGEIRLSHVGFDYGDQPVLQDISLDIGPGAVIALIGPNGVGKSTLVHLILGLSRPRTGDLSASGTRYDEIDMRNLRRAIGVVPQHPTFFTGTVRENICYGRPDATEEDILAALATAQAGEFVAALPLGLETPIAENGVRLSGGEKQRLAVARALISRPKLLILDEPTNHLDTSALAALMTALVRLPGRPGILIISHDPSVLRHADLVYELQDGRLHPKAAAVATSVTEAG